MAEGEFDEIAVDLSRFLPALSCRLIFDVGANTGQTVKALRRCYPKATIHAFEPSSASFERLSRRFPKDRSLHLHNFALGETEGTAQLTANGASTGNRIIEDATVETETIRIESGDAFCERHAIEHIDLLKVDTEGFDLQVLRGFERLLKGEAIDVLQVEASMNSTNTKHQPFGDFVTYLEGFGYYLFGIYEQVRERDGRPILRRSNPVFCSSRQAIKNRMPR